MLLVEKKDSLKKNEITAVITDPPYYDAIAYADLSDFFYIWLKRTLGDIYPQNFMTPQTPKTEECTALKHHHSNDKTKAMQHFENKLAEIFTAIEYQTSDIVSIMFAHQKTTAWTTLCNSILAAKMNITGSWPIDTELANRSIALAGAALASSVTVSCRPVSDIEQYGSYRKVHKAIVAAVDTAVPALYDLGFRGADLLTACFGKAVSEFGHYEIVEKNNGDEVTVAELLDLARTLAFNSLVKNFAGDDYTKFYISWLQLYGFVETNFDDAAKFSRIGFQVNVAELFNQHLLLKKGNVQTLANYTERLHANQNIGTNDDKCLINQVHRAMHLYKNKSRHILLSYINEIELQGDSNFWRVADSLSELLPKGIDDHEQVRGLLNNKENLLKESKNNANLFEPKAKKDLFA